VTALGVLCITWGALHLADASLQGSGRTFETRPRYDEAKRRTHGALPGALLRCGVGLVLLVAGARLRRGDDATP
jgi:hypothetical protein